MNVLLVHSDLAQPSVLLEKLRNSFDVHWVSTVEQAIAHASQNKPDAIVVKLRWDNSDDLLLMGQLTINCPAVPLLLIHQFEHSEPGRSVEHFSLMSHVERVLMVPDDDADRVLLGLHVLLTSEYLPPALQAIMDTFCQGPAHPFLALDAHFRCVYANSAASGYTGFTPGELIGKGFWDIFPDAQSAATQQRLTIAVTLRMPDRFEFFLRSRRIWLELRVFPWRCGISLLMAEATGRKNIEREPIESKAPGESLEQREAESGGTTHTSQLLQALAIELTQTEYRERRRLAQMLHDNLLQLLVAARMHTGMALARAADLPLHDLLLQADTLLAESIEMSRAVMFELSPRALHESGLTPALHSLARHMRERYGLQVEISSQSEVHVPPDDRILLFEAARELLFNVLKHSRKGAARVSLSAKDSRLILAVEDTGRGFDVVSYLRHSSEANVFGLFSIKQRLELVGGGLDINSRIGQGTSVYVTLPIRTRA
jgi:PAS domain S-box-containing protein